jgi:hypothetical protein
MFLRISHDSIGSLKPLTASLYYCTKTPSCQFTQTRVHVHHAGPIFTKLRSRKHKRRVFVRFKISKATLERRALVQRTWKYKLMSDVYSSFCKYVPRGGGLWEDDWFYCSCDHDFPLASCCHINEKEILAVVIAVHWWAPQWANHIVSFFSGNSATVASINKCS